MDLRLHYVITSRRPAFHDSFRWIKGFPDPGHITSIISIIRSLRWRPKHGGKKSLVFKRASSGAPLEPFLKPRRVGDVFEGQIVGSTWGMCGIRIPQLLAIENRGEMRFKRSKYCAEVIGEAPNQKQSPAMGGISTIPHFFGCFEVN